MNIVSETSLEDINGMSYLEYLKTPYWQEVKHRVRLRDRRCCKCKSKYLLEVHHLTYKNIGDELSHLEDLVLLCRRCHVKEHPEKQSAIQSAIAKEEEETKKQERKERLKNEIPLLKEYAESDFCSSKIKSAIVDLIEELEDLKQQAIVNE